MMDARATFVVTGAANGIGLATSKLLSSIGVNTINCDCETTAGENYIFLNLSNMNSISECVQSIPDDIDGLINCAGIAPVGHPNALILQVNWFGTKLFAEKLMSKIKRHGSVTTVASRAGANWEQNVSDIQPYFQASNNNFPSEVNLENISAARAYEISKELLVLWSTMNAATHESIRFNTVSPSSVKTRLTPSFKEAFRHRQIHNSVIRKHTTEPNEIAQAIWFLANPANQSINGVDLKVDQGITARRKIVELGYI